MPFPASALAKLTRPRLARAVARERLFAELDRSRALAKAICVIGPPGAGKTTLAASWLEARAAKGIWYQVDAGDADLPTFFHYLGRASLPFARKRQRPLPALTPEYLHDVQGFARRFFRELFSRLPPAAVFALDNYQEVDPGQPFHEIVARAVEEVPAERTLLVISRRDSPESYARLIANEHVASIDWDALKLTLEEAQAIGRQRGNSDAAQIRALHARAEGWAAGLTLLLERVRHAETTAQAESSDSLGEVFGYFAGELFDRTDAAEQRLLLALSFLPRMAASAARELTGTETALALLEDLHRRHLFTDRRLAGEPVYQFHALFQAFLRHRAASTLSLTQQTELTRRAASVLERGGQPEDAMPLYLRAGEFAAARGLVLRLAPHLIGQGRWQLVVEWVGSLPQATLDSDPWLVHWLGAAWFGVDPPRARALLERAHVLAREADGRLCQALAAAGIIQAYMLEYTRFRPMDPWIEVLLNLLQGGVEFPSADAELTARSALMIALAYRRPDDARLEALTERVFELVQGEGEPNLKALATAYLVAYGATTGPFRVAQRARPLLERILEQPGVTALTRGWGGFILAYYFLCACDERACLAACSRLAAFGEAEGLPEVVRLAAIVASWQEVGIGNLPSAERWLRVLESVARPGQPYDRASAVSLRAHLALSRGDLRAARAPAQEAADWYEEAGTHFHRCYSQVALAWATMDEPAQAERAALRGLDLAVATRTSWLETEARLTYAQVLSQQGEQAHALDNLRRGFEVARLTDCRWPFRFLRPWTPRFCAQALAAGIEPDFVKDLIRRIGVAPPAPTLEAWPWPVKVYTLGQFRVLIDDQPLAFSRKVPRKPIALLKAVVAMGGREVREERLIDALWPQESADAAHDAFAQTLLRLRRLLGTGDAVRLVEGRVSLDAARVWTDVRAFEGCADGAAHADGLERALTLYRGAFLEDETDQPWAVSLRERLRTKFLHLVSRAGAALEAAQRWDEAVALYLRGLDAEALSESFYQGLMRCHAARGRHAEALSAYRRLRQQLSVVLGMSPSASSEVLARELRLHAG
jgi:DNA-binding SARP family transcriptional activator